MPEAWLSQIRVLLIVFSAIVGVTTAFFPTKIQLHRDMSDMQEKLMKESKNRFSEIDEQLDQMAIEITRLQTRQKLKQ